MLKKLLSVFLCLATVFVFASCKEEASGDSNETSSHIASVEDISSGTESVTSYEKIIPATVEPKDETVFKNWISQRTEIEDINAGDYDDIITKTYTPDDIDVFSLAAWRSMYLAVNFQPYEAPIDENEFECYRTAGNNIIYTIIKLDNGTLIYTYYTCDGDDYIPSYAIAASKKLSSKDFDKITAGSNLNDIYKIDSALNNDNYRASPLIVSPDEVDEDEVIYGEEGNWVRLVLLTDGLLELKGEIKENKEYIITEKVLHSDFRYICNVPLMDGTAAEHDYTILEKDYPKN